MDLGPTGRETQSLTDGPSLLLLSLSVIPTPPSCLTPRGLRALAMWSTHSTTRHVISAIITRLTRGISWWISLNNLELVLGWGTRGGFYFLPREPDFDQRRAENSMSM